MIRRKVIAFKILFALYFMYKRLIKMFLKILFILFSFIASVGAWNSIQEMNAEFEKRFINKNEISYNEWIKALPTSHERKEIETLIDYLMMFSTFDNLSPTKILSFYPYLQKSINITFYKVCFIFKKHTII